MTAATYPRWTVVTKRRRLTLHGGVPRLERTLLTEQASAIDVGAWLDHHRACAHANGRVVAYLILAQLIEGIAPIPITDPTSLIDLSREAHHPRVTMPLRTSWMSSRWGY